MPILKRSILQMQQEGVVDGQLRIGTSSPGRNGGKQPQKLTTWRMTSPSREAIEAAAQMFGGAAAPWASDRGPQWEVITPIAELPVQFGGGAEVDQWMTHWEQGILMRRCTGAEDAIDEVTGRPCECNATGNELCKPETKLRVRFLELPGIGWWRFTSKGKFVASGFPQRAQYLTAAAERNVYVPAKLVLREMKLPPKTPGAPGRRFPVVDIAIQRSIAQVFRGEGVGTLQEIIMGRESLAITGTPRAALPVGGVPEIEAARPADATPGSTLTTPMPPAAPAQPELPAAERAQRFADLVRTDPGKLPQVIAWVAKGGLGGELVTLVDSDEFMPLAQLLAQRVADLAQAVTEGAKIRQALEWAHGGGIVDQLVTLPDSAEQITLLRALGLRLDELTPAGAA